MVQLFDVQIALVWILTSESILFLELSGLSSTITLVENYHDNLE